VNSQQTRPIDPGPNTGPFDELLVWLHPDREIALERFQHIRRVLIKIFECRACGDAEDLADETIDRVVAKVPAVVPSYSGDPSLYFYGVARHVIQEYKRRPKNALLQEEAASATAENADSSEIEFKCLDDCLQTLGERERDFILRYYSYDGPSLKSAIRRDVAKQLGLTIANMRIRAFRIRAKLHDCVEDCVSSAA
jgi:RNA polymerase sigma factor (sigma-70 family)